MRRGVETSQPFGTTTQEVLGKSTPDEELTVVSNGAISFEMIEPAMQAVYDLPTRD